MLVVISPAKTLDYETPAKTSNFTIPDLLDDSAELIATLKELSPAQLAKLMGISDKLAGLNAARFGSWSLPFDPDNAKQALLAFKGDVYTGLNAESFKAADFKFAQKHLRILSGLYGLLRPLDLIQAYRLEMGTKLQNNRGKDLYAFWANKITEQINSQLKKQKNPVLVNLASNEYFKSIKTHNLIGEVITPVFKEDKNGQYKVMAFFAKKARGRMSAFIIKNKITEPEAIKNFDDDGYTYNKKLSSSKEWVFTRTH
ncbi:MAG TPA: peroxide stress protein YaaA [Pseudomonadales bacterium]